MPVTSDVLGLSRMGLLIGIIYVIQSIVCTIYTTVKLAQYFLEKKEAEAAHQTFVEDGETTAILAILWSIGATFIIISSLLIVGIIKRNHKQFIPWLYISSSLICVTGIYIFVTVYRLIWYNIDNSNYPETDANASVITILILSLTFGLQIAVYKIIKRLYYELSYERDIHIFETSSATYIIHEMETD